MEVIDQRDRRNWQSVGCSKMDDAEQKDKGVGKDSETAHSVLLAAPIDKDYYKIEHLGDDVEVPYNLNLKVQYYPRPGPSSCWFARPVLYYTNKEGKPTRSCEVVNHLDIGSHRSTLLFSQTSLRWVTNNLVVGFQASSSEYLS